MNKYQRLIKRLMKYGIFAAIVLVVNLAILIFLVEYSDSLDQEQEKIEIEARRIANQNRELLSKHERAKASLDLYQRLVGNNIQNTFSVEKRLITNLLQKLNTEYQLRNLQLEVKPAEYREEPPYTLKTGTLITSDVIISYESIVDSFAFAFTEDLFEGLSHFLLVRNYLIDKKSEIDGPTLLRTQRQAIPTLTKGEIRFRWIGLRVEEEDE